MSRFAITYPGIPLVPNSIINAGYWCPRVLRLSQTYPTVLGSSTVLPIPQSQDTVIIPNISHCTLPIPQSWDTWIIPDISHSAESHSVPLSFPSHSPGILELPQTYPAVLGLTQSHCPFHPTVRGYWDYPGPVPLYSVSLSPHCPSHPTVPGYWDYPGHIPLYWVSLSPTLSFPSHSPEYCNYPRHIPLYWVSFSLSIRKSRNARNIQSYSTSPGLT